MPRRGDDLGDLVRAKIENLRPKLLDLSRRNPLISTKLGPRSNSHIRAVDELPDVLFFTLSNGEEMEFAPLPPIEEDPRDELTDTFREAVINARLIDEAYAEAMEAVDRDSDDYLDATRQIERALKDRVREQLGLPPRVQKSEINLIQHAKNNGIIPSYELPEPNDEHEDGRHTDEKIQTLLLPNDLERKLNSITSKSRTWIQETGMNVLQIAFGFLEWTEDGLVDSSFAPLVFLPVEIKRIRTPQGAKFTVANSGDEPEFNAVLAEKLRIDFSIEIPPFDGSSIEAYFDAVQSALPKKRNWRVRRQVAIGVFPSARMAMYHDIDPQQPHFPDSEIISSLLAGSDSAGATPFADEYDVDEPETESKIPYLVMDADSSQFSTLVDIADGKNVAVEGPPRHGQISNNRECNCLGYPDRFTVEEACSLARRASSEALALAQTRGKLEDWGISENTSFSDLEALKNQLDICAKHIGNHSQKFVLELLSGNNPTLLSNYLNQCRSAQDDQKELDLHIAVEIDTSVVNALRSVENVCSQISSQTISVTDITERLNEADKSAKSSRSIVAAFRPLISSCDAARTWLLDDIANAHALYRQAGR